MILQQMYHQKSLETMARLGILCGVQEMISLQEDQGLLS